MYSNSNKFTAVSTTDKLYRKATVPGKLIGIIDLDCASKYHYSCLTYLSKTFFRIGANSVKEEPVYTGFLYGG